MKLPVQIFIQDYTPTKAYDSKDARRIHEDIGAAMELHKEISILSLSVISVQSSAERVQELQHKKTLEQMLKFIEMTFTQNLQSGIIQSLTHSSIVRQTGSGTDKPNAETKKKSTSLISTNLTQ